MTRIITIKIPTKCKAAEKKLNRAVRTLLVSTKIPFRIQPTRPSVTGRSIVSRQVKIIAPKTVAIKINGLMKACSSCEAKTVMKRKTLTMKQIMIEIHMKTV